MPPLARATACDGLRALVARGRSRPRLAVSALALLVASPVAGLAVGSTLAETLGSALREREVARALVGGLVLTVLSAGLALGLVLPAIAGLGEQAAAAPAHGADRALALLGLPLGGALGLGGMLIASVAHPVVAESPGGTSALAGLLVTLGGALCAGGAFGGALRARSQQPVGSAAVLGALPILIAVPSLLVADAVEGSGSARLAASVGGLVLVVAIAGWGAVASRMDDRGRLVRRDRPLPSRLEAATASAALRLLVRRRDLRSTRLGALLIGGAGIGLALVGRAPAPAATLLAITGAALTAIPCGLAAGGALRDGAHVWTAAPPRRVVAAAWLGASAVVALAPAALVGAVAFAADRLLSGTLVAAAVAVAIWSAAVLSGTLVRWRSTGVADQAAALGVCALVCAGLALVASLGGPRTAQIGVPGWLTAVALLSALAGGAWSGLHRVLAAR